ncbi:MAG TPA: NAD(P)H-dependent glycerol-3-phosphate dehydrogenase [Burkholderiales bacterium]|nr:NAD(P)H-dependent glycerol-3-phosphate dehydrogenase [Burkholderiales bacterium]
MKIAVLGAGAWGTAIAISLAQRHSVCLWTRDPAQCALLRAARTNQRYLPGYAFPAQLQICDDPAHALADADLVLIAVATGGLRETLQRIKREHSTAGVIWLCKGFEPGRAKLPHEVCAEVLGDTRTSGALSGPSFAQEVAQGLPTAVTVASHSPDFARDAARILHSTAFRVYSSDDLIGVEVAAAMKNVIAIAAGISDGLRYGYNARAALITRGLAEVTRFGVALGGRPETFMGLAGAGDLILTCTGDLSRNRQVGLKLAGGQPLGEILAELGHVAEGVGTAREINAKAGQMKLDMPITRAVCRVLYDHVQARAAADELLQRQPRSEV